VNTLDARIGYRGRYEWLGKASARLDDLLNLVPARLTAGLLLAGGLLLGAHVRAGLAILRRDGARTESPNAGRPMATMAGLLGVELEKVGHYRLGDAQHPVDAGTIIAAWRIAFVAMVLAAMGASGHGGPGRLEWLRLRSHGLAVRRACTAARTRTSSPPSGSAR
jgi:adenosylcobinamide-phosphate synthase